MKISRLANVDSFSESPELAMDIQIGMQHGRLFIVVGGRTVVEPDRDGRGNELLLAPWLKRDIDAEHRAKMFDKWFTELPHFEECVPISPEDALGPLKENVSFASASERLLLAYIVGPLQPLPSTPWRPRHVHGHLPFGTRTDNQSVIYRWEAYPTSRRIHRTAGGGSVDAGTYAAPASEAAFVPSGFAAVGRFALPTLLPACFRYELQPMPTLIHCGASVPLYGQAGGGVEVCFPMLTSCRSPIANPIVLEPM